jgi:hypothetical protein
MLYLSQVSVLVKGNQRFGSWLCFRHQVKEWNVLCMGPLHVDNTCPWSGIEIYPTECALYFYLMMEAEPTSETLLP